MVERHQAYKCMVCGIVAEILDVGAGELVCCGQPMRLMTPRPAESDDEMHAVRVEPAASGVKVRVGADQGHPMQAKHFIQWIELLADGAQHRRFLAPGDDPEAFFAVTGENCVARGFCNLHGLLKG